MDMVNAKSKQDPNTLRLSKPEMRWEHDAFLAFHEANRMRATGDNRIRPLNEVSEVDPEWEQSVFTSLDYLRYLEDYYSNLSPEVRAMVESTPDEE